MNRSLSGRYIGRFAPSPTGPLHAGSLLAALASWLDARAHGGRWLVRIEDLDATRCITGTDAEILRQLTACGLHSDAPPLYQSGRDRAYAEALAQLDTAGWVYPCGCTRKDVDDALAAAGGATHERHRERVYPGTCRPERGGLAGRPARSIRVRTESDGQPVVIAWHDRRLGAMTQDVAREVGDFVLRRADGLWAYQLAVVVDDGWQGITHVVRGEDLADNTPRQILLQRALGLPTPAYLHTPLVLGPDGEKLSKQNGATPLDVRDPLAALRTAGMALRIATAGRTVGEWLAGAVAAWRDQWVA
jgi:glutamyl-Q tRNA(Asp) synthetase